MPGAALAQGSAATLIIPAGQQVRGDSATGTQSIAVLGDDTGDVTSWGGDISVQGHVG
ncbi:MAG: hypothetical protein H7Y32_19650, partial [Chloroflexales bacterium]|nr:hypothetical protein [Chloroflexales bacterium]